MVVRIFLAFLTLLFFAGSVSSFDCSVQCPYGTGPVSEGGNGLFFVSGLARESEVECNLIGDPTDPFSWCMAMYTFDNDDMWCSSCGPITYKLDTCKRVAVDTYSWTCEGVNDSAEASVPCCGPITPAACGGGCGVAACAVGECINNVCADPGCPSDADCVCDAGLRLALSLQPM